jgi:hypothetical protein
VYKTCVTVASQPVAFVAIADQGNSVKQRPIETELLREPLKRSETIPKQKLILTQRQSYIIRTMSDGNIANDYPFEDLKKLGSRFFRDIFYNTRAMHIQADLSIHKRLLSFLLEYSLDVYHCFSE